MKTIRNKKSSAESNPIQTTSGETKREADKEKVSSLGTGRRIIADTPSEMTTATGCNVIKKTETAADQSWPTAVRKPED
jgi:hypothetical protein